MSYGESYKYALTKRGQAMLERMQYCPLAYVPNTPMDRLCYGLSLTHSGW